MPVVRKPDVARVATLHGKAFPDHRIAAKLKLPLGEIVKHRRRLKLAAHPANSRLTVAQVAAEIVKWEGMIRSVVRAWKLRYPACEVEDLYSEAVAGCLRAGESFDPRKGFSFSTYAFGDRGWVRNHLQRYVHAEVTRGFRGTGEGRQISPVKLASIHSMGADDNDRAAWEPCAIAESDDDAERRRNRNDDEWWERTTQGLDDRTKRAILLRYRYEWGIAVIAFEMQLTDTTVRNIIASGLQRMRSEVPL